MTLSRCNHCGGEATLEQETNIIQNLYGISCWQVKCISCGMRTGYGKKEEVVEQWNRTPPIKTNYDFVKSLPLEQMARFITEPLCNRIDDSECLTHSTCTRCYCVWLNKEVKTDA